MDSPPKTQKTYHNHRRNQRERILEAAAKLFIRDGIKSVSMNAIAKTARMSRVTLYEYYANKQDIAWAIYEKIVKERYSDLGSVLLSDGTGFERIEQFMLQLVKELENAPEHMRFLVELDAVYAIERNPARLLQIVGYDARDLPVTRVVREGIEDGSLRPDLNPDLITAAMLNLISAANNRFALLGDLVSQESGQPMMSIYLEIVSTFLRGIQSTPSLHRRREPRAGVRGG